MKKLQLYILVLSIILFSSACSVNKVKEVDINKHILGYTAMDMTDYSYRITEESIRAIVESNGDKLITAGGKLDNETQIDEILKMIDDGIEILFLNPVDSKGILPALEECKKAGVKIITINSRVEDESYIETFVGNNNYKLGNLIGKEMKKDFPAGGKLAVIMNPKNTSSVNRLNGLIDSLDGSGIDIVACKEVSKYEQVIPVCEEMIKEHPEINMFWGFNDDITLLMRSVVAIENLDKRVFVYGTGEKAKLKSAVDNGDIKAISIQNSEKWGEICGSLAYKILEGENVKDNYYVKSEIFTDS